MNEQGAWGSFFCLCSARHTTIVPCRKVGLPLVTPDSSVIGHDLFYSLVFHYFWWFVGFLCDSIDYTFILLLGTSWGEWTQACELVFVRNQMKNKNQRDCMGRVLLVTVIAGLLLSGCGDKRVEIPEPESRPVKLQAVSVGDNDTFRTFPATVEAGDKAVLAFRVSGQLASVYVTPGQPVTKGQKMASLNTDELELLVEQAQAQYELAYVQFKRNAELRKTNVVSELDYDQSKSALSQAKATLDKAKANLGYATLVAPYDGTLSLSLIENYEYVTAKQPVMHIQSAGLIDVTFQLPEQLLASYRFQGSYDVRPTVTFDTLPEQSFAAQFKEIDTEADPKTSSYKVTLSLERPEGKKCPAGDGGTGQDKPASRRHWRGTSAGDYPGR